MHGTFLYAHGDASQASPLAVLDNDNDSDNENWYSQRSVHKAVTCPYSRVRGSWSLLSLFGEKFDHAETFYLSLPPPTSCHVKRSGPVPAWNQRLKSVAEALSAVLWVC